MSEKSGNDSEKKKGGYPPNKGIFDDEPVSARMMMRIAPYIFDRRMDVPGYSKNGSAHAAEQIAELEVHVVRQRVSRKIILSEE